MCGRQENDFHLQVTVGLRKKEREWSNTTAIETLYAKRSILNVLFQTFSIRNNLLESSPNCLLKHCDMKVTNRVSSANH